MIVGCYSLHLYCDAKGHVRVYQHPDGNGIVSAEAEYTAEFGSECRRDARKDGWKLSRRNSKAICPKCVRAGRTVATGARV